MRSRDARPRSYFPLWTLEPRRSLEKRVPPLLSFVSPGGVPNRDRVTALALVGSPAPRALGAAPVSPGASRLPESDNGSSWVAGEPKEYRRASARLAVRVASAWPVAPNSEGWLWTGFPPGAGQTDHVYGALEGHCGGRGAPPSERSKTAEPARTLCKDLTVL